MVNLLNVLKAPVAPFNNVYCKNGRFFSKNSTSFYQTVPDENCLTFDTGNQKVLANVSLSGAISTLTFYRENHYTEEKPGVWVNKVLAQTRGIEFAIKVNGGLRQLSINNHDFVIDSILDSVPRIQHRFSGVDVKEIPFCPINNGDTRQSMLVVGFWIHNRSTQSINVELPIPKLYDKKLSDQQNVLVAAVGESNAKIKPNSWAKMGIALIDPDCYDELPLLAHFDINAALERTLSYYDDMYGGFNLDNPQMTVLFRRAIYQSLLAIAMDKDGHIVGSNWGSYPATSRIWNKDMFYSILPSVMLDGHLCTLALKWFNRYCVKPNGTKFKGGLTHSVGNSLAAAMLAGLYFHWFNDKEFFLKNPEILSHAVKVVKNIEDKRPHKSSSLVHSKWVSDAYALGDYHTGSNICLWVASVGLARICAAVGRLKDAEYLLKLGTRVHQEIDDFLTIKGAFGDQWLEGRNADGNYLHVALDNYHGDIDRQGMVFLDYMIKNGCLNLMMHDGEESDTTLSPFYGFVESSSPVYQNTMLFTGSAHNPTYAAPVEGISWGQESGATFPGFVSILMGHDQNANEFEEAAKELIKLSDLDGSWWWWPYQVGSQRGKVVRNFNCGKCAWASGMFVCLFISQYLGLGTHNGYLQIDPMQGLGKYTWINAHLGMYKFDISISPKEIILRNRRHIPFTALITGQMVNIAGDDCIKVERSK